MAIDPTSPSYFLLDALVAANKCSDSFPATELIKELVHGVAFDVCAFKQNHQASYSFVSRARDIRDEINTLIKNVDSNDSWDDYELFVNAIDPLEKLLLEFALLAEEYSRSSLLEDSTASVAQYEKGIKDWVDQRKTIQEFCAKLYTESSFENIPALSLPNYAEINAAVEKHDDSALLSALCTGVKNHSHSVDDKYNQTAQQCIQALESLANNIEVKFGTKYDNDTAILSIKCVALLNTAAALCETAPNAEYIRSHEIWQPAQMLLTDLEQHLNEGLTETGGVEKKWEDLVELLKGDKSETPEPPAKVTVAFEELRRRVPKVKRPYFGQAYITVHQFMEIQKHLNGKEYDDIPILDAFKSAQDALEKAAAAAFDILNISNFNEGEIDTNDTGAAFATAQAKIATCFGAYKIEGQNNHAHKFAEMVKADKVRVKQVKDWLQKRTRPTVSPGEQVKVTVVWRDVTAKASSEHSDTSSDKGSGSSDHGDTSSGDGSGSPDHSDTSSDEGHGSSVGSEDSADEKAHAEQYTMDNKTTLNAVLWRAISKDSAEQRTRLLTKAHFESEDSKRLSLETEIGTLVKEGQAELKLYLVIAL